MSTISPPREERLTKYFSDANVLNFVCVSHCQCPPPHCRQTGNHPSGTLATDLPLAVLPYTLTITILPSCQFNVDTAKYALDQVWGKHSKQYGNETFPPETMVWFLFWILLRSWSRHCKTGHLVKNLNVKFTNETNFYKVKLYSVKVRDG